MRPACSTPILNILWELKYHKQSRLNLLCAKDSVREKDKAKLFALAAENSRRVNRLSHGRIWSAHDSHEVNL